MAMMVTVVEGAPLLARGRGLGKLIEGLTAGDPVAWSITVGVVAILIGVAVYKHYHGTD